MHRIITIIAAVVAASAIAASFAMPTSLAAGSVITGRASVIDGDTVDIQGTRIRLEGVDAPESWQQCKDAEGVSYRCGKVSAEALDRFLAESRPTTCTVHEFDRYSRAVASCIREDGKVIQAWLVDNGFAIDVPRYSDGRYSEFQERARVAKRGMWAGSFDDPCVVRAQRARRQPHC